MAQRIDLMAEDLETMNPPAISPASPPVTIPIAFVQGMLAGVRARGAAAEVFLEDAGIDPELLAEAGARVTASQYVALFQSLTDRLDDDLLGFLTRPLRRGSFALIVRSAAAEDTLEAAMRRAARTCGLLQSDVAMELVKEGELAGLVLRFDDATAASLAPLHELLLRSFWRFFAWLVGGKLPARRFDFAFACPAYAGSYSKIFPAALRFDEPRSGFWIDAAQLQQPLVRDKAAVKAFLADARSNVIVPPREEDLVSTRVRQLLQRSQPAWPELATVAEELHMAASTLQRRLAANGTSFQALKDELRRDLAIVRLHTSAVPLAALALELGFADSAAFQRAFKNWTGSAPGAYRQRSRLGKA
jgi:AraC-like DNA-binding protein